MRYQAVSRLFFSCASVALVLFLSSTVCSAGTTWDGEYGYHEYYGKTYGGSAMLREYSVSIDNNKCMIVMTGYQTYEELTCSPVIKNDTLTMYFKSYPSGEVVNPHGIKIYDVNQPLLKFERIAGNNEEGFVTHWLGLETLDLEVPEAGEYFEHVDEGDLDNASRD